MNISLTPQLELFVNTKVDSGRYNSASEVVIDDLPHFEDQDPARAPQLGEIKQEQERLLDSLDRGVVVEPAVALARLKKKSQERRKTNR